MTEMKIKAIAPWYGSKRTLAPRIVELMGSHKIYWEPFCGSMSVLLAKPPCELETVNDLHGDLINLAKVVQCKDLSLQLYEKLTRTLYHEQLFREAKERCAAAAPNVVDVERAYNYFVMSWMGINGVSGTKRYNYQFAMRWCVGGGQGARRWSSVIESMPAWHKRLRNVVIVQRDAFEIIENIKDETGCVVYCDPPYFDKSCSYLHDFESESHQRLAMGLQRFKKAHVIVSYYDDPKLDTLYEGFTKLKFPIAKSSLRNANRGAPKKPRKLLAEVLLTNKPITGELFQ